MKTPNAPLLARSVRPALTALVAAAGFTLGGCAVVPAYGPYYGPPGPAVVVAPPPPAVVAYPAGPGWGWGWGRHRHW